MILDSVETNMNIENSIYVENKKMTSFSPDYERIEQGERYLRLPNGLSEICAEAFSSYNSSGVIQNITRLLLFPEDKIAEWSKKQYGKKLVKVTFPPEAGTTVRERAMYMLEKEKRVRLLRLHIPQSIERIQTGKFPALLEEITVDEENPCFTALEGCLYTKDGKTLLRFPGYIGEGTCVIPEGVETLAIGAFKDAFVRKLILPSSLRKIEKGCFENTCIDELTIKDGLRTIPQDCFLECRIGKIGLPSSIKNLEDYAFRKISGLTEFSCEGNDMSVGVGLFAEGHFDNVDWWNWDVIPAAAFLNSDIKEISVPAGVKRISNYAFAGCWKTKKIVLPESVKEIEENSFDEGDRYQGEISIPKTLYKFVYRLPAMSEINKTAKYAIWDQRTDLEFCERKDVLKKQASAFEKNLQSLNKLQFTHKKRIEKEINEINKLLNA